MLAAIHSQALRAHEMIADLMLFARPPQLVREEVDLVGLVDRVIGELKPESDRRGTRIERRGTARTVMGDSVQLAVALRAMCVNALEALSRGGRISIEVRDHGSRDGAAWVEVILADNGPGISSRVRRHLFDPFFSGREAGRGLGFGLSKAWRIVTDHGGRIDVESPAEGGAVFRVVLRVDGAVAVAGAC
jgi:hypothetical protein